MDQDIGEYAEWLAPPLKIRPTIAGSRGRGNSRLIEGASPGSRLIQQSSTVFTDPRPTKAFQIVFDDWAINGVSQKILGPTFPTESLAKSYVDSQKGNKAKNLSIEAKDIEDEKFWVQVTQKPKKRGKGKEYFVKVHETAEEFQNSLPEDLSKYLGLIPYNDTISREKWNDGELTKQDGKPAVIGMDPIYRAGKYFGYPKYLDARKRKEPWVGGRNSIAPTILQNFARSGTNDRWFWGTNGNGADFDELVESLSEEQVDLESLFNNGVAQIKGEDGNLSEEYINFAMAHGVSRNSGASMHVGRSTGSYPYGDEPSDWGIASIKSIQMINSDLKNLGYSLVNLGPKGHKLTKLEKNLLASVRPVGYEDDWAGSIQSSQKQIANPLPVLDESRPLNVGDLNDWLNENEVGSYQVFPKDKQFSKVAEDDFLEEMMVYFDDTNQKRVEQMPLKNVNWNDVNWNGMTSEDSSQPHTTFRHNRGALAGPGLKLPVGRPLTQTAPWRKTLIRRERLPNVTNKSWRYSRKFGAAGPDGVAVYENYSPIVFPNKETARVIAAFQRSNGIPTRTVQIQRKAKGGEKWINLMKKGISPNLYLRRIKNGEK